MKPALKEIYLDIENHLKKYGFKLYKGKVWKYDPVIGYVIGVEVELTRWGTLNELYVCGSSYRAPIKQNKHSAKKEPLPLTWLRTNTLYSRHGGESVFAMGSPYQPVDITLRQQYETLRPYLERQVFPLLMFDTDTKTYLQNTEKLHIMACEAFWGVEGVTDMSLVLEYCYHNDIDSALRIIDLYMVLCDAQIQSIAEGYKHLPSDKRQKIPDNWEQEKKKACGLAETIQSEPETVRRMIEENTAVSIKNCGSFFTSRFFSR